MEVDTQVLPILPLERAVILPHMAVTLSMESSEAKEALAAARAEQGLVLVVPRINGKYARVGTIAKIEDTGRLPNGSEVVVIRGLNRGIIGAGVPGTGTALRVQVEPVSDDNPSQRAIQLSREYKAIVESLLEQQGASDATRFLRGMSDPGQIADTAGYSPLLSPEQKVEVLETIDVEQRRDKLITWGREALAESSLKDKIRTDVTSGLDKAQREHLLRMQMDAIRKELGEGDDDIVGEYRKKIEEAGMPEAVRAEAERELDRLERSTPQNPEHGWIRTYLDWMVELPWSKRSDDTFDIAEARRILDADHTGLDDVKDRIIEFLAVKKLRADRGIATAGGRGPRALITPVGPPGGGQKSLGGARAPGPGRQVAPGAPGGLPPEEEKVAIGRNHLLGRQVERNGLQESEVEVTDDALRHIIGDHTREAGVRNLERELGKVLRKAATQIAAGELTPPVVVDGAAVRKFLGKPKFHFEAAERTGVPGVATGLAVTGAGGDVLFIEATSMESGASHAGLTLTGQLGDVMKESAQIALSYVRSHAAELGIDPKAFENRTFHLHVPAGAVPKDGPSAGVTMTTALVSLLTGRPVRSVVGMTGEVTLQGRVLPIGGLKQEALAAHRAGLKEVILPGRNEVDLDDLPESVKEQMTFHVATEVTQVLGWALEPAPAAVPQPAQAA